jgi:hypothetical protein
MLERTALQHYAWAILSILVVADGRSFALRQSKLQGETLNNNAQDPVVTPCPCLVTPAPLMTPEEMQASAAVSASDVAQVLAAAHVQEAAKDAAQPIKDELNALKASDVESMAKAALTEIEQNQTSGLKAVLEAEVIKQKGELGAMEASAKLMATAGAEHLRGTAEQWAKNQARNYIVQSASGTLSAASQTMQQMMDVRQQATQLTKSAIQSANESLAVALKAQEAMNLVPKETLKNAEENAEKSAEEQKGFKEEIEHTEANVREIAKVAQLSQKVALATLEEAEKAEITAREALATSRGNAVKIEALKTRAATILETANQAEKAFESKV